MSSQGAQIHRWEGGAPRHPPSTYQEGSSMEGSFELAAGGSRPRHAMRMTWRLLLTSFLALATWLSVGVIVLSTPASAIGNGRFSVAPVSASKQGRTYFTPVLSPG